MENRTAIYRHDEHTNYDTEIAIKVNGSEEKISCLSKKQYEHKKTGKVVGYLHKNNRQYSGREYAALKGLSEAELDIYSQKKFTEVVIGYVETTDGEYLAITKNNSGLFILLAAVIALLIVGICFAALRNRFQTSSSSKVLNPVGEVPSVEEQTETADENQNILNARIALPAGGIDFNGEIDAAEDELAKLEDPSYQGTPYNGSITATAVITVNEAEYVWMNAQQLNIEQGVPASASLDFTILEFELTPGVYDGSMHITYPDGTELDKAMSIAVVSSISGNLGISYADQAEIDLANATINLTYTPDNSPYDSFVQIIVVSDGEEYILGQSNLVKNNQTLNTIALDESMKDLLQEGVYDGIMRVYIASEDSEDTVADIHTDIEIDLIVQ